VHALAQAGAVCLPQAAPAASQGLVVGNVTGLYPVQVARIATPRTADEVAQHLRAWPGQVAVEGGLHLDMRQMRQLVWLRPAEHTVRVQAGMRWRDLQDHLDPLGLAVMTMQSYANFSVGGSVAVNAHGRYVGHGPVGHSVRALQLVLADGSVVEATRQSNAELFRASLGGYGAVGVITEVELDLADNVRIERVVQPVALEAYVEHVRAQVLADPRAVMHNADLLPPAFDAPVSVLWRRAGPDQPLTDTARLVPRGQSYRMEQGAIWAMTELPAGPALRQRVLQPMLLGKPSVRWLNREASLDVAELEPRSRSEATYVLQEYFVPAHQVAPFARVLAGLLRHHRVQALNVSIRHSPADRDALMAWAADEVFSFVLYHRQGTGAAARAQVGVWTRALIDAVLAHQGRYYLPYQLHATQAQFDAAYPQAKALAALKRRVDPQGKLSNALWSKYL
jgi:FAD/FMN-containing dehydrogenase